MLPMSGPACPTICSAALWVVCQTWHHGDEGHLAAQSGERLADPQPPERW
jgi:hypothetical protein